MKHSIKFNYKNNYRLIGIVSPSKAHRLCSAINRKISISLTRVSQLPEFDSMYDGAFPYAAFRYDDNILKHKIILIANHNELGCFLKERKELDYLIFLKVNEAAPKPEHITHELNKIDIIQLAFVIDWNKLRSRKKLIIE